MSEWIESKFHQKRIGSIYLKIIEHSNGQCWIEIKFGESLVYKSPKPIDGGGEEAKKGASKLAQEKLCGLD